MIKRCARLTSSVVPSACVLFQIAAAYGFAQKAQRYVNAPYHFSLEVPEHWAFAAKSPKALVELAGPKTNDFAVNVNITAGQVGSASLSEYTNEIKKKYEQVLEDQKTRTQHNQVVHVTDIKISDEKTTSLGGLPAKSWRVRVSVPNKSAIAERQVFSIHGKYCYSVTFATLEQNRTQDDPTFDKLLSSFRWEK